MLLSILIPSHNHEQFVLSTIQAAARIDVADKEIIVIDDGSSDSSVRVIREYIASLNTSANIQFIARENRGLVKTLNEGLSISRGKYFYAVASDDIPIPEGVAALLKILQNDDDLQFALGNALYMDSEEQREFRPAYGEAHRRFFALPYEQRRKQMYLRYPQPILLQATVFRTSALKSMNGWREDIVVDDFSLFLRMLSQLKQVGKDFAYHPEIMACFYRQHPSNSYRNLMRQFTMVEQALAKLSPPEWRDAALFRNFALHGLHALRTRKARLFAEMFYSTVRHMGVLRFLRALVSESGGMMRYALSRRRRVDEAGSTVIHEPPAKNMGYPQSASF